MSRDNQGVTLTSHGIIRASEGPGEPESTNASAVRRMCCKIYVLMRTFRVLANFDSPANV